ncbi:hypothetical protein CKK21_22775 [Enterobacter cloacae]|nr:hypothetical protein CKK21_22775 [Enterobacter cloacae]
MTTNRIGVFIKNNRLPIFVVFSMCILYVLPIIMADRLYVDDMGRTTTGYYGWKGNGRPFAEMIMKFLSLEGLT